MTKKRDYRKEYDDYHALSEQRTRNAARKRAQRKLKPKPGFHVDHKDFNPLNEKPSNLRIVKGTTNLKRQPKTKTRRVKKK